MLASYILYLMEHTKHIYGRIVFISNSTLSVEDRGKISKYCGKIIERPNTGFDFGAWKDAITGEGRTELAGYDSLTLMNDTCFGPVFDIKTVYEEMEHCDVDFWGLVNHRTTDRGMPGTDGAVSEHIQSYFICFNKKMLVAKEFYDFWKNVKQEKVQIK